MIKKTILILIIGAMCSIQLIAQNIQSAQQFTQSCYLATNGKIIIDAGGHYTSAVSEQVSLRDSLRSSSFDTVSSAFKNNKRISFTYDAGGLIIESLAKTVDKSGTTWSNSQQTSFKYTGFQLYEETIRNWDKTLSDWANFFNYKYSYEADNSLLSIFYQPWDAINQEWDYSTKDLFTYDANNKVITVANQKWNKNLGTWENYLRTNFTYSGGYISLKVYQLWNKSTQTWDDYQKETISYTSSMKSEVVLQVKTLTAEWENYSRTLYTYENALLSSSTEYFWYGSWTENKKYLHTYNAENMVITTVTQNWAAHLGSFRNLAQDESFYSKREVIGIDETPVSAFSVNNPVSKFGVLTISGLQENTKYQVSLISLNGSLLMNKSISTGESIALNNQIPNGIYMVNIATSGMKNTILKVLITD